MTSVVDPTVLIVEDEPEVLDLLSRALGEHHFRCLPAASLQQAKIGVERENLDVIVTDLALGDGSGLELLKYVRCAHPSLPVIIVTGFPSIHVAEEALRLGAFDLIEKPFNTRAMAEVVIEAAATRRRQIATVHETLAVMNRPAAFVDRVGRIVTANSRWNQLFGDSLGRHGNELVAADSPIAVSDLLAGLGESDSARAEISLATCGGPLRAELSVAQIRERRAQPGGYVLTVDPPSGVQAAGGPGENRNADPLTGCLSHRGFFEALDALRRAGLRQSCPVGLLLVNVNDFSAINQSQGYDAGDQILQHLAGEIRRVVRDDDLLGRYGPDVFAVALRESGEEECVAASRRLCAALATANDEGGAAGVPIGVTIGITACPAGYTTSHRELVEQAAAAIEWSREHRGEGPVAVYRSGMTLEAHGVEANRDEIEQLTREFAEANERLKASYIESARALVAAVEAKDPYTRQHSDGVSRCAALLAEEMKLPTPYQNSVRYAALLHDVGKIGIADRILTKPGALTPEEFELVKQHPVIGANIVSHVSCMRREVPLVQHHHENWDGSGYPAGLKDRVIPLGARILRVADSVDCLLGRRSYKEPLPFEEVVAEIERCRGTCYDPRIVDVFLSLAKRRPEELAPVEQMAGAAGR
jgi:diguanylate cyclase (GGDEF)-like protein